jgi:hypothetical protein
METGLMSLSLFSQKTHIICNIYQISNEWVLATKWREKIGGKNMAVGSAKKFGGKNVRNIWREKWQEKIRREKMAGKFGGRLREKRRRQQIKQGKMESKQSHALCLPTTL